MDDLDDILLDIGCILEQAAGVTALLRSDSQSAEFSTPIPQVYSAIGAIGRLLEVAEQRRNELESALIAERRQRAGEGQG